jgi:hypothetical protein
VDVVSLLIWGVALIWVVLCFLGYGGLDLMKAAWHWLQHRRARRQEAK